MIGEDSIGEHALGETGGSGNAITTVPFFDWFSTVISQYANSPVVLKLVENMTDYIDPTANFEAFFNFIFNVDTAVGYGLDVWGRVVGVSRVLHLPGDEDYFGFSESADGFPFDEGIFFGGGTLTTNFSLSDTAYRRLILAKALANISDGSIPSINQILINLFGSYGNCYVTDDGNMEMTYTFATTLSVVDFAIVSQSGVLPRPAGVSATIVQL